MSGEKPEYDPPPEDRSPLAVVILGFAVFNFFMFPLLQSATGPEVVFPCLGVLAGQAGLIAAWGVFSPMAFFRRLYRAALVGLLVYGSLALGLATTVQVSAPGSEFWMAILVGLSCLPLVYFSLQIPLWGLQVWLGWHVAHVDYGTPPLRSIQIKDLVLATAAVSVALAITRGGAAIIPSEGVDEFRIATFVIVPIAAVCSAIGIVPVLYFVLGDHADGIRWGGLMTWFVLMNLCGQPAVMLITGQYLGPTLTGTLLIAGASFTGVVAGAFYLVRNEGYRLICSPASPDSQTEPAGKAVTTRLV